MLKDFIEFNQVFSGFTDEPLLHSWRAGELGNNRIPLTGASISYANPVSQPVTVSFYF